MAEVADGNAEVSQEQAKDAATNLKGGITGFKQFSSTVSAVFCPELAGGILDKVLYYVVLLVVIIIFLVSLTGFARIASEKVVSINQALESELQIPAIYFCLNGDSADAVLGATSSLRSGPSAQGVIGLKNLTTSAVYTVNPGATAAALPAGAPQVLADIQLFFKSNDGSTKPYPACSIINFDGGMKSTEANPTLFALDIVTKATPSDKTMILYFGFFPANGTPLSADKSELLYPINFLGFGNEITVFGLSLTKVVDVAGAAIRSSSTKFQWQQSANGFPLMPVRSSPNSGSSTTIGWYVNSFLVTTITRRFMTFAEVWAALGGLWAASMVVLGIFFKTRSVTVVPGAPKDVNATVSLGLWRGQKDVEAWVEEKRDSMGEAGQPQIPPGVEELVQALRQEIEEAKAVAAAAAADAAAAAAAAAEAQAQASGGGVLLSSVAAAVEEEEESEKAD